MLIEMPRFSIAKLLFHHYKSDLAHTTFLKYEQKIIEKRMTCEAMKFAQFLVVSVRKCMVKKYLISDRFGFLGRFCFCGFFYNSVRPFLYYLVKKESVILRSLSCFNPYFLL